MLDKLSKIVAGYDRLEYFLLLRVIQVATEQCEKSLDFVDSALRNSGHINNRIRDHQLAAASLQILSDHLQRWMAEHGVGHNCSYCFCKKYHLCQAGKYNGVKSILKEYILFAVGSSRILIGKQKLGVTFNSDKLGGIDFTKFSKLTMCSAGASRCWLVQWPGLPPRHCTWSVLKFL